MGQSYSENYDDHHYICAHLFAPFFLHPGHVIIPFTLILLFSLCILHQTLIEPIVALLEIKPSMEGITQIPPPKNPSTAPSTQPESSPLRFVVKLSGLKKQSSTPSETPSLKPDNSCNSSQSFSNPDSNFKSSSSSHTKSHSNHSKQSKEKHVKEESNQLFRPYVAKSVILQLLEPKKRFYRMVPLGTNPNQWPNDVEPDKVLMPNDAEEALLMIAALSAIGRRDALYLLESNITSTIESEIEKINHLDHDRRLKNEEFLMSIPMNDSDECSRLYIENGIIIVKLNEREKNIALNASKSARHTAKTLLKSHHDDDDSLALELELEFTQLDAKTRGELLKQIDESETNAFTESGNRAERIFAASKQAQFHNLQLEYDRSRIGPYYFDHHTRSHMVYHSISIPKPVANPTTVVSIPAGSVADSSNTSCSMTDQSPSSKLNPPQNHLEVTCINPDLVLPSGFSYPKQSQHDLHFSLQTSTAIANNPNISLNPSSNNKIVPHHPVFKMIIKPQQQQQTASTFPPATMSPASSTTPNAGNNASTPSIHPTTPISSASANHSNLNPIPTTVGSISSGFDRFNLFDGYSEWLKEELESHLSNSSNPLNAHSAWNLQFKSQWDSLLPRRVLDFVTSSPNFSSNNYSYLPNSNSNNATSSNNNLEMAASSSLGPSSTSNIGLSSSTTVSSKSNKSGLINSHFIQVWREHTHHLESEKGVELAMEAAQRTWTRMRFGDPEDDYIDPIKPLTRDERRRIVKREKEMQKLMEIFLDYKLINLQQEELNLSVLSWYDLQSLFASIGLNAHTVLEEYASKNQLPAIYITANGQVKARSHKKGAQKAARAAAKKAGLSMDGTPLSVATSPGSGSGTNFGNVNGQSQGNDHDHSDNLSHGNQSMAHEIGHLAAKSKSKGKRGQPAFDQDDPESSRILSFMPPQKKQKSPNSAVTATCNECSRHVSPPVLNCASCRGSFHTKCLQLSPKASDMVYHYKWKCPDCKVCEQCQKTGNESKFIFCSNCDRSFHRYCLQLPDDEIPEDWVCSICSNK